MKTATIKIGLLIGVLLFLCSATSWAEGRKYHHHDNKHAYKAKPSKSNHYRYDRIPHLSGHDKRHYYAQRPGHSFGRHHMRHHPHHYYRPFHRYHHRHHYNFHYPYRYGFWMYWRSYQCSVPEINYKIISCDHHRLFGEIDALNHSRSYRILTRRYAWGCLQINAVARYLG